jgi:hypothetical protein
MTGEQIDRANNSFATNERMSLIHPAFFVPYCGPGDEWLPLKKSKVAQTLESQFAVPQSDVANVPLRTWKKGGVQQLEEHAGPPYVQSKDQEPPQILRVWKKRSDRAHSARPSCRASSSRLPSRRNDSSADRQTAQILGNSPSVDVIQTAYGQHVHTSSISEERLNSHSQQETMSQAAAQPIHGVDELCVTKSAPTSPRSDIKGDKRDSQPLVKSQHTGSANTVDSSSSYFNMNADKRDSEGLPKGESQHTGSEKTVDTSSTDSCLGGAQPKAKPFHKGYCYVSNELMQLATPQVSGIHGLLFASAVCLNQVKCSMGCMKTLKDIIRPLHLACAIGSRNAFFGAVPKDSRHVTAFILRNEALMCFSRASSLRC